MRTPSYLLAVSVIKGVITGTAAAASATVTPVYAENVKPYVWSFSKPSESSYNMTVGAQLPVPGRPAFGSDINMPAALPRHVLNAPRSYVPSGTLWTRLRFEDDYKLAGMDETDLTLRFDPDSDLASTRFTAGKKIKLTRHANLLLRDSYSFRTPGFETNDIDWITTKSVEVSLGPTATVLAAEFNNSKDDAVWHSSVSLQQPLTKAFTLRASIREIQTQNPSSVFKARYSRTW